MIVLLFTDNKLTINELEELTIFFWENKSYNPNITIAES
jgi:DNA-binding XRE family transcriptional regulator